MLEKTLIIKLRSDVTAASPLQRAALKHLWQATFEPAFDDVSFEVGEEDEASQVERLLSLVRPEFCTADADKESEENTD